MIYCGCVCAVCVCVCVVSERSMTTCRQFLIHIVATRNRIILFPLHVRRSSHTHLYLFRMSVAALVSGYQMKTFCSFGHRIFHQTTMFCCVWALLSVSMAFKTNRYYYVWEYIEHIRSVGFSVDSCISFKQPLSTSSFMCCFYDLSFPFSEI